MAETTNDEEALRIKSETGPKCEEDAPGRGLVPNDQRGVIGSDDNDHNGIERVSTLGETHDVPATTPDKPYSAFSSKEKWAIIVLISLASVFS